MLGWPRKALRLPDVPIGAPGGKNATQTWSSLRTMMSHQDGGPCGSESAWSRRVFSLQISSCSPSEDTKTAPSTLRMSSPKRRHPAACRTLTGDASGESGASNIDSGRRSRDSMAFAYTRGSVDPRREGRNSTDGLTVEASRRFHPRRYVLRKTAIGSRDEGRLPTRAAGLRRAREIGRAHV